MNKYYSFEKIKNNLRKSDTLIVKFFYVPIACRIAYILINYTNFRPYFISLLGLISGFCSAYFFLENKIFYAIPFFLLSIISDFTDGLVARVKKNGNVIGILFDTYFDFIILILNTLAIILSNSDNTFLSLLMITYLIIHFIESWIDFGIFSVYKFLKKNKFQINFFEQRLIKIKNHLEKFKLRTIFFSYQERFFCLFVISPLINFNETFLMLTIFLTIFFINFKVIFDVALIKHSIKKNIKQSVKFRENTNE